MMNRARADFWPTVVGVADKPAPEVTKETLVVVVITSSDPVIPVPAKWSVAPTGRFSPVRVTSLVVPRWNQFKANPSRRGTGWAEAATQPPAPSVRQRARRRSASV